MHFKQRLKMCQVAKYNFFKGLDILDLFVQSKCYSILSKNCFHQNTVKQNFAIHVQREKLKQY
jgi:hypothetical protein